MTAPVRHLVDVHPDGLYEPYCDQCGGEVQFAPATGVWSHVREPATSHPVRLRPVRQPAEEVAVGDVPVASPLEDDEPYCSQCGEAVVLASAYGEHAGTWSHVERPEYRHAAVPDELLEVLEPPTDYLPEKE